MTRPATTGYTPYRYNPLPVRQIEEYELRQTWITGIVYGGVRDTMPADHPMAGTYITFARGHASHEYGRPIIQLFDDGVTSSLGARSAPPCPSCDNWAYTARCKRHPEMPPPFAVADL